MQIPHLTKFAMALALVAEHPRTSVAAAPTPGDTHPLVTVGRITDTPEIDGRLGPGEWATAAAITGFRDLQPGQAGRVVEPSTTAYIAWDDAHLFIALDIPSTLPPLGRVTDRDDMVYEDDDPEIFIDPGRTRSRYYQFLGNCLGTPWTRAIGLAGAWTNRVWDFRAHVYEGGWSCEMRIPFGTVGVDMPPADDAVWGFNAAYNRKTPRGELSIWSLTTTGFHQPENFGGLRFEREGVVFRARSIGRGRGQAIEIDAEAVNLGSTANACTVLAILARDGEEVQRVKATSHLEPGPGSSAVVPLRLTPPEIGDYEIELLARDVSGQLLYRQPLACRIEPLLEIGDRLPSVGDKVDVGIRMKKDLLPAPPQSVELELRSATSDEILARESAPVRPSDTQWVNLNIGGAPPGDYRLTAKARGGDGQVLATADQVAVRPPAPRWVGSPAGRIAVVPHPWTPLEAGQDSISCWGREYQWTTLPFPAQVSSHGEPILAGPIRVNTSVGGEQVAWRTAGPQVSAQRSSPNGAEARIERAAEGEGLRLAGSAVAEYDGMLRIDFSLSAASPVPVDHLFIDIPFLPERATFRHFYPHPRRAGRTPAEPYGMVFTPMIWLGNESKGLCWFAESDEGWAPADPQSAIEIIPGGEEVVLRLHLWDLPRTIGEPQRFTMGLQATPVKPWPADWHRQKFANGIWWQHGWGQPLVHDVRVTYPAGDHLKPDQGTLELWVKPLFDPAAPSPPVQRTLLEAVLASGEGFRFFWDPETHGLVFHSPGDASGKGLLLHADAGTLRQEAWHHVALTWGGQELSIWGDGRRIATGPLSTNAFAEPAEGDRIVVGGVTDFIVDALRISNNARSSFDPDQAPAPDRHTLLLDHFDEQFHPDEFRQTHAGKIASRPGLTGGRVATGAKFVPGRFGHAVQLRSHPGVTRPEYVQQMGANIAPFGENWADIQNYPRAWKPGQFRSLVNDFHRRDIRVLARFGFEISDIAPEWPVHGRECIREPLSLPYQRQASGGEPPQNAYIVCYRSHWADFLIEGIQQAKQEFGFDGVYLDGTAHPHDCANRNHGCGYLDAKGRLKPSYPIFAVRDVMKRIYALFPPDQGGIIVVHNSGGVPLPTVSSATSLYTGEHWGVYTRGRHLLDYIPLDVFRAEFGGQNWGIPVHLIAPARVITDEEMMSLGLLHRSSTWGYMMPWSPGMAGSLEEIAAWWRLVEGFGADEADWFPYWDNAAYVRTSHPDSVKVSFYRNENTGLLLVVSNLGEHDLSSVMIEVDHAALGMPQPERATLWTYGLGQTPIEFTAGRTSLALPKWSPRLIQIQ